MGLWRGAPAVAAGAGPAHAIYFGVYEYSKYCFTGMSGQRDNTVNHLVVGLSGACATASSEAVFTPVDVVKQRVQVMRGQTSASAENCTSRGLTGAVSDFLQVRHHNGILDCIKHILREEGVGAFYRAYKTTLVMSIPYTALHFVTYESIKEKLNNLRHVIARAMNRRNGDLTFAVWSLPSGSAPNKRVMCERAEYAFA